MRMSGGWLPKKRIVLGNLEGVQYGEDGARRINSSSAGSIVCTATSGHSA